MQQTSRVVRAQEFREPWFVERTAELHEPTQIHRKLWEFCVIAQGYKQLCQPHSKVLGFGVGLEVLPAWFAAQGATVVATDHPNVTARWDSTGQHATSLESLRRSNVCPDEVFDERVTFAPLDMNAIPTGLHGQFDFTWSTGSFEHLGSIEKGLRFFCEQMRCLKPGGIAVHTTEFNSNNTDATRNDEDLVFFRRQELERLSDMLAEQGDELFSLDLTQGGEPEDLHVDKYPFGLPHLRLEVGPYVTTSVVLMARRGTGVSTPRRPRLLWVGDAGCPSGFARATHETLETLRRHYDVTVLGLNYRGDPHTYPYPIWACAPGGDSFGIGRLIWMCDFMHPDIIVIQNDPWNIQEYILQLDRFPEYKHIPVVAAIAVDGLNIRGGWFRGLAHVIFWTKFGLKEARKGGYTGPATVIPLGVDTDVYHVVDKQGARARRVPSIADKFIVGNVNRNQPRKRWDLTLKYFAKWIKQLGPDATEDQVRTASLVITDAFLYLHTAPTGDHGVDVKELAKYYGILDHLALMEPPTFYGIPESEMRDTYNCFDVCISTTQGEGMGLTTMEAMACQVACIVPGWAALGDWAEDAAWQVPCTATAVGAPYVTIIGGIADEALFIAALDTLYRDKGLRESWGMRGLSCMQEPRYRWANIGQAWLKALDGVLGRLGPAVGAERQTEAAKPLPETAEAAWADLGRVDEVPT